mgnify:CR=1 FL=1
MSMTTWSSWALALLPGLVVGSFLNVVIERLPRMLLRQWREQARELLEGTGEWVPAPGQESSEPAVSLARPGSHCPQCRTPIAWYFNIPLLGFLMLKGRCRACAKPISWQYPAVELLTAIWFGVVFFWWGLSVTALCWAGFGSALLVLSFIYAKHQWLPDDITLPLCWAGLLAAGAGLIAVDLWSAVLGASLGYVLLWGVAQAYWLIKKQQGMGQGDFKLLAALGAWLGWQSISMLVLMASILGIAHGLLRPRSVRLASPHFPFGPSLCLAATLLVMGGRGQPVLPVW